MRWGHGVPGTQTNRNFPTAGGWVGVSGTDTLQHTPPATKLCAWSLWPRQGSQLGQRDSRCPGSPGASFLPSEPCQQTLSVLLLLAWYRPPASLMGHVLQAQGPFPHNALVT